MKAQRALISLFGRHQNYVIAEATQSLSLQDHTVEDDRDALWLGCCVVPKEEGICQYVASLPQMVSNEGEHIKEKSIYLVPDLRKDRRFNELNIVTDSPKARFYAGAPIISPKGITIRSFCIIDNDPRSRLDASSIKFLQDIALTVITHLDIARRKTEFHRAERIIVGFGSFIEGKATLPNKWVHTTRIRQSQQQNDKGHVNIQQQNAQLKCSLLTTIHTRLSSLPPESQKINHKQPISSSLLTKPSPTFFPRSPPSPLTIQSVKSLEGNADQISSLNTAETETSFSIQNIVLTKNLQEDILSTRVR